MNEDEAIEEIRRLVAEHALSFTFNPGGAAFYKSGWGRCQIHTYDHVEDVARLKAWIASNLHR